MIDQLLQQAKERIESGEIIGPGEYLSIAEKINILRSELDDSYWARMQEVSDIKVKFIEAGNTVSKADAMIKATDQFREAMQLKSKMDRVTELIRLSKHRARMSLEEFKGN